MADEGCWTRLLGMENTVHVSDDELRDITRRAIDRHFEKDGNDQIEIKLEKRIPPRTLDGEAEPTVVSVWIMHLKKTFLPDPKSTTAANIDVWETLKERNDDRMVLLYHGFPNDPFRPKKAA